MVANTALAARRAEREDVDAFLAALRPPAGGAAASAAAGSRASADTLPTHPAAAARGRPAPAQSTACRPLRRGSRRRRASPTTTCCPTTAPASRAWTNDPDGAIDGPTVVLCNGLGTGPWAWPALLRPDCGVRVVSWNHRGTGGSDRPARPGALRHRGVRRGRPLGDGPLRHRPGAAHGLVDGRQHDVRAGLPPPRAGVRAVRGRGRARRHLRHHAGAARAAPPGRARRSPSTSPGPSSSPAAPITPVTTRLPGRPARDRGAQPQRLHAPGGRPRGRRERGARVPRDPDRVVHAPRHRAPPSTAGSR